MKQIEQLGTGTLVRLAGKPEWGPGKILSIVGATVKVYFRDYPEQKPGDAVRTLNLEIAPLEILENQSDEWLDNLPPYQNGRFEMEKTRLTFEQAVTFFKREFPLAFKDPKYVGNGRGDSTDTGERAYKLRAHLQYVSTLGEGRGRHLLETGKIVELSLAAKSILNKVNILHLQEKITFRDGIDQPAVAEPFFCSLFELIENGPTPERCTEYFDCCGAFGTDVRRATWPTATVLPYLADPTRFMFMKPEPTNEAAERFAFDLHYEARPNWVTYERLLKMSSLLLERLRALGAQDLLDVQSFIYVVRDQAK